MKTQILKFFSPTCGPCKVMDRNLKEAEIPYVSIDVTDEDNEKDINKYNITSIPTIVKIREDGTTEKIIGIKSVNELKNWYNE